jgi:preprotein translocase subunit SecF
MNFMTRINYMKYAKYWIALSIALTIAGLVAFFTFGLNVGIDFTGGHLLDLKFDQAVTTAQVQEVVARVVTGDVVVQKAEVKGEEAGSKSEFLVRTPELSQEAREKLKKELEQLGKYQVVSEDQVSGTVSGELRNRALLAVAIAAVLQILYLWWRFDLKFGVTAVVALLHDVVITIGLVAIFRIQVNAPFVAAILTILGYSINDTVIVFDRVRENLASRKKDEDLVALTTRSIQEVITRSIYTVLTVLLTLVAMLIWGGETIKDFAWTLFIGMSSGMYSSIFIAAALWLYWQQWEESQKKRAGSKPVNA